MSYCKKEGKDQIIFVTKDDHEKPSAVSLPEDEARAGLLLPNGEINWSCPCLGGMATGPCGVGFREAFSCFHFSKVEPKGSDCFDKFRAMQECMVKYPNLYPRAEDDDDDEDDNDVGAAGDSEKKSLATSFQDMEADAESEDLKNETPPSVGKRT